MLKYTHMFVLLLACIAVHAQTKRDGKCPKHRSMKEIDMERYEGTWYLNRQSAPLETKCVTTTYKNSRIQESAIELENGTKIISEGELQIFKGHWNEHFTSPRESNIPYKILCTDYYGYTLLWWCEESTYESEVTSSTTIYILTRDRKPSDEVNKSISKCLKRHRISEGDLKKMIQDCTD